MSVKPIHQSMGKRIVCTPKARYDRSCSAHKKCLGKICHSLFSLKFSHASITGRERYEIGVEPEMNNLADLQKPIIGSCRINPEHNARNALETENPKIRVRPDE